MTTASSNPSSVVSAGTWTNGANVYSSNDVYATNTGATQNTEYPMDIGGFNFAAIPAGSTINSVTVTIEAKTGTANRAQIKGDLYDSTTLLGTRALANLTAADANYTWTPTATLAQLQSANLLVRVTNKRIVSQASTTSVDYVKIDVDYTAPQPAITQAAYRFYADGFAHDSVALAAQDTGYTADTSGGDVNLQVRVRLQETNAVTVPTTTDWRLQWEKNTSGSWTNVYEAGEVPADEYPGINTYNHFAFQTSNRAQAQSFLGNGQKLSRAAFFLYRDSAAANVGNLFATLYAHTGTFGGEFATPTGSALATSTNTVDAQTGIPTSQATAAWVEFTFADTFTLANGTPYYIVVDSSASFGTGSNDGVYIANNSSGAHPGNRASRNSAGTWSGSTGDNSFKVFAHSGLTGDTAVAYASASLVNYSLASTSRLTGGTGTFVAGRVSEGGQIIDVGWSASNHTELLYSITLKQANLAADDTLRFRVVKDGATTGLTYTQYPTITIGGGVPPPPSGTATGAYAWARTTATGQVDKRATSVGTYAWNRTAATGAKLTTGTAVGGYAYAGTATGDTPPNRGTAVGTYAWAGTAVGVRPVVPAKTGTAAGTYAFNRTTATGTRTPKGQTTGGTYTWTGNAQGQAPEVGVNAGTAIGAYLWARTTATGYVTRSGSSTVGAYAYVGTGIGSRPPKATATGSYAFNLTAATGSRPAKAAASGTWNWSGTGTGQKTPRGAATGAYAYAGTAAGTSTHRGTAAGSYAYSGTAAGAKTQRGTATGTYLWARTTATGTRTPKASSSGIYNWSGTGTGYRLPKATSTTGAHHWAGTATGIRPIPGVKQGTAQGFYTYTGTGFAATTRRGTSTGGYLYAGTGTGSRTQRGTATGTYTWSGTAAGVVVRRGTSTGTYLWARTTATGKRTPKASAAGAYLYAGTATGATPGVVHYVEDFNGHPTQVWHAGTRYPIQTF